MHNFEKLKIWQKAMDIAVAVYDISLQLPNDEKFNLIHQIKKCAVSIPSNIAEGFGRQTDKSFNHFLNISRGSLNEIETQLIIAKELEFIQNENIFNELLFLIEEESKMINAFSKNLK